jgi:hypothetical protein
MLNAHFKCKHISQFKGLINMINYWKWKDKERAKRRGVGSIQTGTSFDTWVITGVVELGFRSGLSWWKANT